MDLDEYVWRKKMTLKKIALDTGICAVTLSNIKASKITPKLSTALKICIFTNGEVTIEELLPKEMQEEIKNYKITHDKQKSV